MKKIVYSLCVLFLIKANIYAQKIPITKADDLPRRSVTVKGTAQEILKDDAQLNKLTQDFVQNLEGDLEKYDIQDRATLKSYYQTMLVCYAYQSNYEKALSLIPKIQELCDKNSEKLTVGIFLRAYTDAIKQSPDNQSEGFKKIFTQNYAQIWNSLPFAEVKEELEAQKGSLSLFNPNLVTASLDSQIQPFLDNNKNIVPDGIVMNFITIRFTLERRVHLVPIMLQVLTEIYEKNKSSIAKQDIWASRDVALSSTEIASPVVVAIWDSGVDVNIFPKNILHQDKNGKNGVGYSLVEYKNDGLLLENPEGKIKTDVKKLQALTKGFFDIQSAIESSEANEVRKTVATIKPEELESFEEELAFYGLYSHGTHVAGIALKDNPFARLLVARMGWNYHSNPPAHTLKQSKFQAKMYQEIVQYFKDNDVRVVNMSWRYGVSAYEGLLSLNGIGKNDEERKKMAREMFEIEKKALYEAFKNAPEILFVCGSGNENNDASFEEYIPASFDDLPNLITIGAVDSEGKKTSFTTEGKSVLFYANGYEVESFVPGGDKVKFSGTSMASPNVVNLAAKILALRPNLTPTEVIDWINKGADNLPENPTLKLINPKKTIELLTGKELKGDLKESLQKKWKPTPETANLMAEDYIEEVRKQDANQAKALEGQKSMLAQMFAQVVIDYQTNGKLEILVPQSAPQQGTWSLITENNQPKLTTQVAGQEDYEWVNEVDDNTLRTTTSKGKKYTYVAL